MPGLQQRIADALDSGEFHGLVPYQQGRSQNVKNTDLPQGLNLVILNESRSYELWWWTGIPNSVSWFI